MSGKIALADTNVLIYLLRGDETAAALLEDFDVQISFIIHIELLSFAGLTPLVESKIERMIQSLHVIHSDKFLVKVASQFRREYRLEMPDAIIAATAYNYSLSLLTADKVFSRVNQIEVIQYKK